MKLLPFTFRKLPSGNVLVVNQGGEFIILAHAQFDSLMNATREAVPDSLTPLLLSKHFLTHDDDNELELQLLATKLRTRKSFLRDFTSLHMIVLTTRCNCVCDYCHASSVDTYEKGADMTWQVAKASIDLIFQSPSTEIKIEFQGGEPLLNWDVLVKCVLYAEELNKTNNYRCKGFVICTNLMLINEDKLNFCKEHTIDISTSFDGHRTLHDLHRKSRDGSSCYNVFIEKLELTRKILGADSVNALLTITKDHLAVLEETIDSYVKLGFRGVFLRAINPYGYAVNNKNKVSYDIRDFIESYKTALAYIISLNLHGRNFVEFYASLLMQRILTPFPTGFVDLQSPSGAGVSGVIYDYCGEIYPADEARMLARMDDKTFLMGHALKHSYYEIFNGKTINRLVKNSCTETLTSCATCVYQLYCGADPIRYYVESKDIRGKRPLSEFCKKNKSIFDHIFGLIEDNNENVMNVLWAWATNKNVKEVCLEND